MKTSLLLGIHMHQPVDNFEWVIEMGIETCYEPFFEVMSRYPEFKFSVHCSGWLMERIAQLRPSLYEKILTLAHNGSIEFFSAGYYEPILSVIPSRDRLAQIERLNESIKEQFNQTPKGLWLTERVWESALIPDLNRAGIKYTVMDDYHFQCAGFDREGLDGYYMSEEGGEPMGLFPISQKLRYAIPFINVESAIQAIKTYNRQQDSAAIIFDDAEKFGMWPGTYEWVYKKGWLEKFIQAVLADDEIETSHYGEYFTSHHSRGIAYLPNVSYYEMGEWSLRADDALALEALKEEMGLERYEREGVKFLKGGIWKNFFVKYPESNRLHKRMVELSRAYQNGEGDFETPLYKLQTNDSLWHGVFGGLYLPNLRDNSYRYLIECENIRYGKKKALVCDENELDGYPKYKSVSAKLIARFDAAYGAQLVELDIRDKCFNYQNTLTRRKEAYHKRLFEVAGDKAAPIEEGIDTIHHASGSFDDTLRDAIIYDWYLKNSFIDHISDENFNTEAFRHCNFHEYGDFANQPFESSLSKISIAFSRDGGIFRGKKGNTKLLKNFSFASETIDFRLHLESEATGGFTYVMEHNFHFSDYEHLLINGASLQASGEIEEIQNFEIIDTVLKKKITFRMDKVFRAHYFKLQTLSQSEQGFDLSIQALSIAFVFDFESSLSLEGSLEITRV
ncbi:MULTISPECIES: alpha-amylase/4-alpha-glucanotransferase domain-containing protein [unclassified Sulfuricurvum]|uniref:alpha-amylase/4-alpha-glucanotransferase domain-containing protein n=1 Tax=unclassified Sulfuricurvum TaxID=2632390 RepID=UPI000299848F|nr:MULTISPECIES: alpha-amylase/4-alpha-glucanotransferase domain-containing protein [unclassified Sulfuricurvum]AFV97389.1 hypothetical protein B649_05375 [Candidatus Sulfuricurvum sp. RIFRC-1]HBM34676.1 DUF1926 domain-containing protein [Sulfuricurvum sp.]